MLFPIVNPKFFRPKREITADMTAQHNARYAEVFAAYAHFAQRNTRPGFSIFVGARIVRPQPWQRTLVYIIPRYFEFGGVPLP